MSSRALVAKAAARPWAIALVVLVVGHTILIATRTYQPGGDWAFIELRTRDVFSANPPLTGAWSRYGWNHPGPILYFALSVPHLLTGRSWQGLWLGAMLLNVAALVVALWLTSRHGRILTGAFAVAAFWTLAAATPHLFTDPWNASVVIVPVITMAASVLAVRTGDRRGVAVALVVFVAAAQTHAAYGLLLLPAALVVIVVGIRNWPRFTLGWGGIAAALCLPTLVDTFVDWPGNLWRAFRFTATSDEPAVGAVETLRVLGRSTSLTGVVEPRLPSFVSVVAGTPWGVLPFAGAIALVVGYVVARRSGWTSSCRAVEGVALLWAGAALMTWRTRGPLLIWLTTWTVALVALTWCTAGAVLVRWIVERTGVGDRAPSWRALVAGLAVAGVTLALAVVNVTGSVGVGYPFQEYTRVVDQFARDAGDVAAEPIAIDMAGADYVAGAVQSALIARLEADGGSPLTRPDQALQMGDERAASSLDGRRLLVQVEARSAPPADSTVLSAWDPLDEAERAEADGLMDALGVVLDEAGLAGRKELLTSDLAPIAALDAPESVTARQADFERLGALHSRGARIVLYLIEP